jgi:hypothetical protein
LVRGRGEANRVLGSERVFGFGSAERRSAPYAELLTEVTRRRDRWYAAMPRELDPKGPPLPPVERGSDIGWWIDASSFADRLRKPRGRARR